MSAQDVLAKAIQAVNEHDADAFAALYSEDAIAPDPQYAEPLRGRDAIRKDIADFLQAFPDLKVRALNVLSNGDTVGCEIEMNGTHKGPLVTPEGPIAATHRRVSSVGARFITVDAQDQISECRRYYDLAGIMAQLGLM